MVLLEQVISPTGANAATAKQKMTKGNLRKLPLARRTKGIDKEICDNRNIRLAGCGDAPQETLSLFARN